MGRIVHATMWDVIIVTGEALVDLVIEPDGEVTAVLGGAPFNTARAAARLGASVQFLGALATDRFGSLLHDALTSDGVGVDHAPRTERPTTLAAAELDPRGAAEYRFYIDGTSAPELTTGDVASLEVVPEVVFTGGLGLVLEPMAQSIVALVEGLSDDTTVFVDINCRPQIIADRETYLERIWRVLRRADVVKVSDEDLAYLLPGVEVAAAADELLRRGPAAVVVTHGSAATFLTTTRGSRNIAVPAPPGAIIDTIGAGDTFGAALLVAWTAAGTHRSRLRIDHVLDDLARAVEAAHAAAAVVVTRRGANPPWRNELPETWAS